MLDPSTKKKLYFAGCVVAQVFCITALVLQGIQLQKVYDAKHTLESLGRDTTGFLTHICLFISVIVFGSLKQLMVWPGLIYQNSCPVAGAGCFDFLNVVLCITLHAMYGGDTVLPAVVGTMSGFMSLSTCSRLTTIFDTSN